MVKYVVKRVIYLIPTLIGVSLLIFTILALMPGNPVDMFLSVDASEEARIAWNEERGLNDPFFVQYYNWVTGIIFRWDWGNNFANGLSVTSDIMLRFPNTFLLACLVSIIGTVIGMLLGVFTAKRQNTWLDTTFSFVGIIGVSMPQFWLGLLLLIWFSLDLKWFPTGGIGTVRHWVLPCVAMGVQQAAILLRFTRSSVLDCILQDYVRTARAKGQRESVITWHHIVRNALIPIITTIGTLFGGALAMGMVIEQIFSINGLGRLLVEAISMRNYPLIRGSVMLLSLCYIVIFLILDLLFAFVDPRIKAEFEGQSKSKAKASMRKLRMAGKAGADA